MILVVAEQKDGKLNRASWEAIAAAQQLVDAGGGSGPLTIAVLGQNVGERGERARGRGRQRRAGRRLAEALAVYTPDAFVQAVRQIIDQHVAAVRCVPAHVSDARLRADAGRRRSIAPSSPTSSASSAVAGAAGVCAADVPGQAHGGRGPGGDAAASHHAARLARFAPMRRSAGRRAAPVTQRLGDD